MSRKVSSSSSAAVSNSPPAVAVPSRLDLPSPVSPSGLSSEGTIIEALFPKCPDAERRILAEKMARSVGLLPGAGGEQQATAGLMDKGDLSAFLKCSRTTVNRLIAAGTLPHVQIGSRILFDPCDVAKFIRSRKARGIQCHRPGRPRKGIPIE